MAFEVDFLQAGDSNGDAICIRYDTQPGYFRVLIVDGGFADTGDRIIAHIETCYQPCARDRIRVDDMVVTHTDNDHAGGLLRVMRYYEVRNLWMNRPWLYAGGIINAFHGNFTHAGLAERIKDMNPNLVALEELATARGIPIRDAFQGTQIGPFTVLAPTFTRFMRLLTDMDRTPESYAPTPSAFNPFNALARTYGGGQTLLTAARETWGLETLSENPAPTSASNESSIVQLANLEGHRVLLTADAGPDALHEAINYAITRNIFGPLACVQVPHHGSRHNVTPAVLNRLLGGPVSGPWVQRGTAYASVGSEKDDYPRRSVANAFLRRGYPVLTTHRGTTGCFKGGAMRAGWSSPTAVPFSNTVED
jgi:hypothetical protein